ncbi:MAG: folate-binding protein [Litorimonas sp.]
MSSARLSRTVFRLSGEGVSDWLSGLTTNSIEENITFAALLTPQGKIIADFFIYKDGEDLLLETATKFAEGLHKRLRMYRLRAPIEIAETDLHVYAVWDEEDMQGHPDPRHASLGNRVVTETPMLETADYDSHRLSLGVPDSEWDFETQQVFPADANMDLLNGVNFSKGCFVGQEVVSRMKRMTTVKKRMRGIITDENAKAGDRVLSGERVIGDILHTNGNSGIAMIRLDRLRAAEHDLTLNDAPVTVMSSVTGENI